MPTQAGETTMPPPVEKRVLCCLNLCGAGVGGWWIFTPQGEESPGSLLGWGRGVLLFAQPQVPAWGKAGPGAEETGQQSLSGGEGSALKPTKLKEGLSGPVSFPQPVGKVGMER